MKKSAAKNLTSVQKNDTPLSEKNFFRCVKCAKKWNEAVKKMSNYVPEELRLKEYVRVRFTTSEKKYLVQQADAAGLTLSDLLRRKIYGIRIADRTEMRTLEMLSTIRNQLAKLGGLFKHLYTTNPIYSKETAAALQFTISTGGDIEAMIHAMKNDFRPNEKEKLEA